MLRQVFTTQLLDQWSWVRAHCSTETKTKTKTRCSGRSIQLDSIIVSYASDHYGQLFSVILAVCFFCVSFILKDGTAAKWNRNEHEEIMWWKQCTSHCIALHRQIVAIWKNHQYQVLWKNEQKLLLRHAMQTCIKDSVHIFAAEKWTASISANKKKNLGN